MPSTIPTDRCEATTWLHARAVRMHHPSLLGHVPARRLRDSAPSITGSQATTPANAKARPTWEPATASARTNPPTVAAIRKSDSPRRNQYMPSPAMRGWATMKNRIA